MNVLLFPTHETAQGVVLCEGALTQPNWGQLRGRKKLHPHQEGQ